jgi:azurin
MKTLLRTLCAIASCTTAFVAAPALAADCSATVESNDAMQFNVKTLSVPAACKTFSVTLKHVGKLPKTAMGHNLVLTVPGDVAAVATDGIAAGVANDYVKPQDTRVIAHSKLIGGGESTQVDIPVASSKPAPTTATSAPSRPQQHHEGHAQAGQLSGLRPSPVAAAGTAAPAAMRWQSSAYTAGLCRPGACPFAFCPHACARCPALLPTDLPLNDQPPHAAAGPELLHLLHQDDDMVVVYKPAGWLVHRTALARHETRFVLQHLRDQIGRHVWPVHRLDQGTCGVLVFGLHKEATQKLTAAFAEHRAHKHYLALARGWSRATSMWTMRCTPTMPHPTLLPSRRRPCCAAGAAGLARVL